MQYKLISLVSVGNIYLDRSLKHVKMLRMCTVIRNLQFFSNLLRGSQPRLTYVTVMYYDKCCFQRYLPSSEASTLHLVQDRCTPSVLLCCVVLVLLEHLVTEPNTASNNYCQNCNGDTPGSFVEPETFTKSRFKV